MHSAGNLGLFLVVVTCSSLLSGVDTQPGIPTHMNNARATQMTLDMKEDHTDLIADELHMGMTKALASRISDGAINWSEVNGTIQCVNDMKILIEDVRSRQPYALQFADAAGKPPAGILQGKWMWNGDYQQCNSIESPFNSVTRHKFKGKYSNVFLFRNGQPLIAGVYPLVIGICLPDTCDKADVIGIAEKLIAIVPLSKENVTVVMVTQDDNPPYSAGTIVYFVISGLLVLLVGLGTLADVVVTHSKQTYVLMEGDPDDDSLSHKNKREVTLDQILSRHVQDGTLRRANAVILEFCMCFSFLSNSKKLLNTSTAAGPLACLNGLRVLSMWWVIQGHSYGFAAELFDNQLYAMSILYKRFTFQAIGNGTFSVDTFFFLSGLLVAYLALKQWKEKGKINWVYYFGHRYWRLTPMYAFIIMFMATMVVHATSGPYQWFGTNPQGAVYEASNLCKSYWWTNLLYINNLYPNYGEPTCMPWSWYLANDMQFYILLSPIIIVTLHKLPIIGWLVSGILIAICIGSRIFLVLYYRIHGENGPISEHTDDTWAQVGPLYTRPFARYSVYIIGMLTGYILQTNHCKIRLNKLVVLIGWSVAIATGLTVVYGLNHYKNSMDQEMSMVASTFYNAFDRTAWSLSLAWLAIACATGYGGWVNAILSWKIWAPLGRLTYAAYLVHPVVIYCLYLNTTVAFHYSDIFLVTTFVSNMVLSYAVAYVVSMVVEAPMMQLEKLILKKG